MRCAAQEEQSGLAVPERGRNPLGNEAIAGRQDVRSVGRRRAGGLVVAVAGGNLAALQLILADQQLRVFRPHENGPLARQFQDELVVEAAGAGKLADDVLFLAAQRQPVLVNPYLPEIKPQCLDCPANLLPQLRDGLLSLLPYGGAKVFQVMCSNRLRQRPEVGKVVDDRDENDAFHFGCKIRYTSRRCNPSTRAASALLPRQRSITAATTALDVFEAADERHGDRFGVVLADDFTEQFHDLQGRDLVAVRQQGRMGDDTRQLQRVAGPIVLQEALQGLFGEVAGGLPPWLARPALAIAR